MNGSRGDSSRTFFKIADKANGYFVHEPISDNRDDVTCRKCFLFNVVQRVSIGLIRSYFIDLRRVEFSREGVMGSQATSSRNTSKSTIIKKIVHTIRITIAL